MMNFLFLLGRILLGGFFVNSSYGHFKNVTMLAGYSKSKGIPMARESVLLSGLMLLLGGFGIIFGVWVNISVFLLIIFLLVASFTIHPYWKVTDQMAKMGDRVNFWKNIALIGALLMLLQIQLPWALSLMK